MIRLILALVALGLPLFIMGPVQADYDFAPLDVPGATDSFPAGINDAGQIVGYYYSPGTHSFLLSDGAYITLDAPGTFNQAWGINNAGQIVGTYFIGIDFHGFLFSDDQYTLLDVPSATRTSAGGINDAGEVVGGYLSDSFHGFFLSDGNTRCSMTLACPERGAGLLQRGSTTPVKLWGRHGFISPATAIQTAFCEKRTAVTPRSASRSRRSLDRSTTRATSSDMASRQPRSSASCGPATAATRGSMCPVRPPPMPLESTMLVKSWDSTATLPTDITASSPPPNEQNGIFWSSDQRTRGSCDAKDEAAVVDPAVDTEAYDALLRDPAAFRLSLASRFLQSWAMAARAWSTKPSRSASIAW